MIGKHLFYALFRLRVRLNHHMRIGAAHPKGADGARSRFSLVGLPGFIALIDIKRTLLPTDIIIFLFTM